MKIIAKFSNGFTDEYKGNRDVKAAWMVTRIDDPMTVVFSGHSLDEDRALKTGWNSINAFCPSVNDHVCPRSGVLFESGRKLAKQYNLKTARQIKAKIRELRAEIKSQFQVEVIKL